MKKLLLSLALLLLSLSALPQQISNSKIQTADKPDVKQYGWGLELNTNFFTGGGLMSDFNGIFLYNVTNFFSLGAGLGIVMPDFNLLGSGVNYFFRMEFILPDAKVSPFITFDAGGKSWFWGDINFFAFVNPVAGLSFRLRNNDRILFGVGYQYMWRNISVYRLYSHNITVRLGYKF